MLVKEEEGKLGSVRDDSSGAVGRASTLMRKEESCVFSSAFSFLYVAVAKEERSGNSMILRHSFRRGKLPRMY